VRRDQLAHILRAAARLTEDNNILVIGSQSILGSFDEDELPEPVWMSVEADIAFFDGDQNKPDLVDAMIEEDSLFHQTHGMYGQGVDLTTWPMALLLWSQFDPWFDLRISSEQSHPFRHFARTVM
jgi:hypothetical protein